MARTSIWRFAAPLVATVLSLFVLKDATATQRFVAVALGALVVSARPSDTPK